MRSSEEIKKLIIDKAISDNRIRAVLLNGSRANPNVTPDKYQDFDIVYMVNDLESFLSDHSWTAIFGDKLIFQMPHQMSFGNNETTESSSFAYLMLFKDGNRIDLTLFPSVKFPAHFLTDSLTVAWLDKDNMFPGISKPSDAGYLIKKPSEKEFLDTCNEFWWVSTYISKGLARNEIIYAKEMLETIVRKMFLKIVEWYIGTETGFSVSTGNHGKFIQNYLSPVLYEEILSTYPDHQVKNIWTSLFTMTDLFGQLALIVSTRLHFQYVSDDEINVRAYLKQLSEDTHH